MPLVNQVGAVVDNAALALKVSNELQEELEYFSEWGVAAIMGKTPEHFLGCSSGDISMIYSSKVQEEV